MDQITLNTQISQGIGERNNHLIPLVKCENIMHKVWIPSLTPFERGPHVIVVIDFLDAMENTAKRSNFIFLIKKIK